MMRLLRPPHIGIFLRSFRLHGTHHAREMIAEICSMWDALATAIITRTGSWPAFDSIASDAPRDPRIPRSELIRELQADHPGTKHRLRHRELRSVRKQAGLLV